MRFLLLALLSMTGCAGAAAGAVSGAVINTAMAGTVSAVRRAQGDCYTVCNPGTSCNKSNGMCEPLPCGGKCNFDEKCESNYLGERCVSAKDVPTVAK
jgi:hypothetical protein